MHPWPTVRCSVKGSIEAVLVRQAGRQYNGKFMRLSRRHVFRYFTAAGLISLARAGETPGPGAIFEMVPPQKSGITWVHSNGKSEQHWLPEAMCSGCAFLD